MAKYVDGFVIPIKKKNLKAYSKMAQLAAKYGKSMERSITTNALATISIPIGD